MQFHFIKYSAFSSFYSPMLGVFSLLLFFLDYLSCLSHHLFLLAQYNLFIFHCFSMIVWIQTNLSQAFSVILAFVSFLFPHQCTHVNKLKKESALKRRGGRERGMWREKTNTKCLTFNKQKKQGKLSKKRKHQTKGGYKIHGRGHEVMK